MIERNEVLLKEVEHAGEYTLADLTSLISEAERGVQGVARTVVAGCWDEERSPVLRVSVYGRSLKA